MTAETRTRHGRTPPVPKRHHTVAEMLQKRFTDSQGKLWFFDRRRPDGAIVRSSPENIFVETHFYSTHASDGSRNPALEVSLGILEGKVDPILEFIVQCARRRDRPALTVEERSTLNDFIMMQLKRSPEMRDHLERHTPLRERVQDAVKQFEAMHGPIPAGVKASLLDDEFMRVARQNAVVHATDWHSPRLHEAVRSRGLVVAYVEDPNAGLILGSDPFVRAGGRGRNDLGNPEVELYFPIAPDVALVSYGTSDVSGLACIDPNAVDHINVLIAQRSNVIASANRELVQKLAESGRRQAP